MGVTIELTDAPADGVRDAIVEPLIAFNIQQTGIDDYRPLAALLRDGEGRIVGGLWGRTVFGWLFVELLFVPDALRSRGLGTELVQRAEREAMARSCHDVWLDTFQFQARGFYERLGYHCFGTLDDYPAGFSRFFMTKRLTASRPALEAPGGSDAALTITTDRTRIDVDAALALLGGTNWARAMPRDTLVKAMQHSLCFGMLQDDRLVGFARVVTYRATFAYLTDVVIDEHWRGRGLAHRLLSDVVAHPDLQGLRRFALLTGDAMKLYEDHGFTVGAGALTYMERK